MAIVIVFVLVAAWAAVLLPPILRSRAEGSRGSVGDFMGRLGALGRANGSGLGYAGPEPLTPIMGPMAPSFPSHLRLPGAMSPVQKRRRDILFGLAGATAFCFLVAAAAGKAMMWVLFLLSLGALGGYVWVLLQIKARRQAQFRSAQHTVAPGRRPMPRPAVASLATVTPLRARPIEPQLALRRSVSW